MDQKAKEYYYRSDIQKRCIHVLCGKVPRDLHITIGGHNITAGTFAKIADAIQGGQIQVGFYNPNKPFVDDNGYAQVPVGFADMNPNRIASYLIGQNALWLTKSPVTHAYEAMVVHEATHAIYDLNGWDCSTQIAEGIAHVAEGWYLWRYGVEPSPGSREGLMVQAARLFFAAKNPSVLMSFQKKHPHDWKRRLSKSLTAAFNALTKDLATDYDLEKPVDFDGI